MKYGEKNNFITEEKKRLKLLECMILNGKLIAIYQFWSDFKKLLKVTIAIDRI